MKKVLVAGFGIEGTALADYFLGKKFKVCVADKKDIHEFDQEKITKFRERGVEFATDAGYLDNLANFDLIAFSPGLEKPELDRIYRSGVSYTTQVNIFFENSPTKNIIGVTGTNGKGTTATLIYEILKSAGLSAYLAGNIGEGVLPLLEKLTADDWVVLELSSFQLRDIKYSPHIAVVLNITPDHLGVHGSFEEYVSCKANIVRFQSSGDFALLNGDYQVAKNLSKFTKAQVVYFSKGDFTQTKFKLLLPGEHNSENAAAAMAVAKVLNINNAVVEAVFRSFKGLPHRLEKIGTFSGVVVVDDSISTTPEAAIAAVRSFKDPKIVILGGFRTGADYSALVGELGKTASVKAVVLIGQTGAEEIYKGLKLTKYQGIILGPFQDFDSAIAACKSASSSGDVVLLSPASKSFDWFVDYIDRAKKFRQLAEKYFK